MPLDNLLEYGQALEPVGAVLAEADVEDDAVGRVFFDGVERLCLEVVAGDDEIEGDDDSGSPALIVEALANASQDIGIPFVINYEDAAAEFWTLSCRMPSFKGYTIACRRFDSM